MTPTYFEKLRASGTEIVQEPTEQPGSDRHNPLTLCYVVNND